MTGAIETIDASQGGFRDRLQDLHSIVIGLVESAGDDYARQFHPDLSPLGWHLRHCVVIDCLWVREYLSGDARLTQPLLDLVLPRRAPKRRRGEHLPARQELLDWARQIFAENRSRLSAASDRRAAWIGPFLAAHHAQHAETMRLVLDQRARAQAGADYQVRAALEPQPMSRQARMIAAGVHAIGADADRRPEIFAFDNERPAMAVRLAGFAIGERPVTNAEYLGFMRATGAPAPQGWRQDGGGAWYSLDASGARDLLADAPVEGVDRTAAGACARWAGAALPHEYQWEAAARRGVLDGTGLVWEWCANRFHPFPGFRPFPYDDYSLPWFDGRHFVLRGGGRRSEAEVRQPSFRNFYVAGAGHIGAGLRLVYPD